MKKALIIAAAVNLLLCSGIQALSASGWKPGEKKYYQYTDPNGEVFYVRNGEDDGIMPLDLVDGFELPSDTYEILEDGTFVPPTILNITSADGSVLPNPTKWRQTGNSFEIVSSEEEMVDPEVTYVLRNGSKISYSSYKYKEAFGDYGVPVYDELPAEVVEGQTISVGGRKYVGVIRSVLDRHYTNVVKPENISVNRRYDSNGNLVDKLGYIGISGIEIPEHIMEKARNGEEVIVRIKGFSLQVRDGFGAGTVLYYQNGKRVSSSAASQIYKVKDTDPASDAGVWTFKLYYRTNAVEVAGDNAYNVSMAKGDTMYISGGVLYEKEILENFNLSQIVVTFDEVIGETYRDKLVWEYVGDYVDPQPAGFYPSGLVRVVDQEEDMEDVRVKYILSHDGQEYFYADYMNALLRLPDGTVRYYLEGVALHAGVCEDMDGNLYYINHTKKAVTDTSWSFVDSKGNQLLPGGTYEFDAEGHCITLPEVIDDSDPADIRNGLVRVPDGGVRYLVDGVPVHRGFARDSEGNYYYIGHGTYALTDCTYTCSRTRGNNLIPGGTFNFDENGYITNLPRIIDGSNPVDIQNGLVRYSDGTIRYLIEGEPTHAGLVQDAEGNTYYINHTGYAIQDVYYPVQKTNGLLEKGGYTFDSNGVLMNTAVPSYWKTELQTTIDRVQSLKAEIGPGAISFVQITDMHIDTVQNLGKPKYVGVLAQNIMNQCDVPFAMITGDSNSRASHGAYEDPETIYDDVAWQDEMLSPIGWNRIARILGNHDGMWGTDSSGGYYRRSLSMDEKYDVFYSRSMRAYTYYYNIAKTVGVDESVEKATYYYLDDEATKVRYINLNSHWAEYSVDDNYFPTYNTFNNAYYYGQAQLEWLANEALDVEEGWTIALFSHVPPIQKYGALVENGTSELYQCRDLYILMGIMEAYCGRTSYSGSFTKYGDWRNVSISVDYSVGTENEGKGEVAGFFSGHTHEDSINYDSSKYFPVIVLRSASSYGTNDSYEAAFDTVVINPDTKRIYMVRTGSGFDRSAKYTPDGSGVTIMMGANPNNPEFVD